jgi:hypothetical protein
MSDTLPKNLKRRAAAWAGQLTSMAKSLAPQHVQPAISSHVEDKGDGTYIIRITADRGIAPDARAQEYGSGLHARRGLKKKYPILPKNRRMLAFYWEVADENPDQFQFLSDGRVLMKSVMHPGIEAANGGKGYIGPAMKELKAKAKAELDVEIRNAIVSDLRAAFGGKPK